MTKGVFSTIVLLTLIGAASGARAQTAPDMHATSQPGSESPAPSSRILVRPQDAPKAGGLDHQFARQAAEAGAMEVALARLAGERATSEKVKGFAQQMIQDHTNANQELARLADMQHIPLPPAMPPDSQPAGTHPATRAGVEGGMPPSGGPAKDEVMARLSQLTGADFDREYMRQAMADHDQAVALFQHQADAGKNADLKAWAAKMLPALRQHQTMARDVAAAIGAVTK
jgi:putative membrane protein